jgi:exopolysaccharide biosynthesis polyprenyl glycosylphosphotransferase
VHELRSKDRPPVEATPREGHTSPDELSPSARPQARRSLLQRWFDGQGWQHLQLIADVVALLAAVACARFAAPSAVVAMEGQRLLWTYPAVALGVLALRGMYRENLKLRTLDEVMRIVAVTSLAAMLVIAGGAVIGTDSTPARLIARAWFFSSAFLIGERLVLQLTREALRAARKIGDTVLIVGAGRVGAAVERRLEEQPDIGLRPIGFLDHDPAPDEEEARNAPVLGDPDQIAEIAERTGTRNVILAFINEPDSVLIPIVRECEALGLNVYLVPRLFEGMNDRFSLEHLGGLPLLGLQGVNPKGWQFTVKHIFDRVGAALILIVLSPVMIGAAIAVKVTSAGPVFFRQRRVGRDGRPFDMLKFRSMRMAPAEPEVVVSGVPEDVAPGGVEGDDRRTPVGRFLRRASMDELPQLLNVLKGEMSIVGPRPERPEFVELFDRSVLHYGDRHRVKSGMTGWAQVHGLRGRTSLSDRLEWDNYYIQNWSLWLDFKILLMTIAVIHRPVE